MKKNVPFTPGEYQVVEKLQRSFEDHGMRQIASVGNLQIVTDKANTKISWDHKANAEFLAAAPIMYKALQDLRGLEAWITDPEMRKFLYNKRETALLKANSSSL